MTVKRCSKCTDIKPVSAFRKCVGHTGGFQNWCRACMRAWKRADKAGHR
jgi:hypothetical protein